MDLRSITRFLAVAEMGSLNKAAKRLNISQPALSKSIQGFEYALGVPLFDRGPRGITLTSFGQTTFEHARRIASELRRLEGNIEAIQSLAYGEINVGVPLGPDSRNLGFAILNMLDEKRRLRINIVNGTRNELIRPLLLGDLDFLVSTLFEPHEIPPSIEQKTLYLDSMTLVTGANHPLVGKESVGMEDLLDYPWIALSGSHDVDTVLTKLLGSDFRYSLLRSGSPMFVKNIIHRSDFIGLVRQDAVSIELRNKLLHEVDISPHIDMAGLFPPQMVGLIFRSDVSLSTGSQALIAQLERSISPNNERAPNPFLPTARL